MLTCEGGGLSDILIDSDVYAYASVDQMLLENNIKEQFMGWHLSNGVLLQKGLYTICRELWNNMEIHEAALELI